MNTHISSRGNPNRPSLDGVEQEIVHFRKPGPVVRGMDSPDIPACLTGAYNLRWSRSPKLVTCPKCMAILKAA